MRSRLLAVASSCALVVALGCSSNGLETGARFDPLNAFPAEATFRWNDAANQLPTDPRLEALEMGPLLKSSAEAKLAERGYRVTSDVKVNYLVSYSLAVNSWIGADDSHAIATLTLLLSNASTGLKAWAGFARAEVHMAATREEREQRLRKVFEEILKDFPPDQSG